MKMYIYDTYCNSQSDRVLDNLWTKYVHSYYKTADFVHRVK